MASWIGAPKKAFAAMLDKDEHGSTFFCIGHRNSQMSTTEDVRPRDACEPARMPPDVVGSVEHGRQQACDRAMENRVSILETRFDLILPTLATKRDLAALRSEIKLDMAGLDSKIERLDNKIENSAADLKTQMHKSQTDMTRWMFSTMMTIIAAMFGMSAMNKPAAVPIAIPAQPATNSLQTAPVLKNSEIAPAVK